MSTPSATATVSQDRRVLEAARDAFDLESKSNSKLKPNEVIFLIEDVCIDTRCMRAALPAKLRATYEDAAKRVRLEDGLEYVTSTLMRDMERALSAM